MGTDVHDLPMLPLIMLLEFGQLSIMVEDPQGTSRRIKFNCSADKTDDSIG